MMRSRIKITSLADRGSRVQFDIAIALMVVIPLLTAAALVVHISQVFYIPVHYYGLCVFGFVVAPAIGFAMVSRYPQLIARLRRYLEDVARGVLPERVSLVARESDVAAIENALNLVLDTLRQRLQRVESEKQGLEQELQEARTLEALGTLASGIAHEINTPLQFIRVNLDFLAEVVHRCLGALREEAASDGSQSRHCKGIGAGDVDSAVADSLDGIDRIAGIVSALRDFAASGDESEMHSLNLNASIRSAVELARNDWKTIADVDLDLDETMPPVMCYGGELKQTLVNLLLNASQSVRDFVETNASQKGRISIASACSQESIMISISDTGTGIAPDVRPHIFSPFFSTRTSEGARGNGLAYAFSTIVNRHGGRLTCVSEEPHGVTFRIELPRVPIDVVNNRHGYIQEGADDEKS